MKIKRFFAGILSIAVIMTASALPAGAAFDTEIGDSSAVSVTEGCVTVGIDGKYDYSALDATIEQINGYRMEACQQGIKNPSTGKALTVSDYVPIKWSYDLGCIAAQRAVEASVVLGHTRPNGLDCFSVVSPNNISSYGECLAWNMRKDLSYGVAQWYAEKEDWVNNNTSAVTGHYTQMIDPSHRSIGLSMFINSDAYYNTTVCAEYSNASPKNTQKLSSQTGTFGVEVPVSDANVKLDYASKNLQKGGTQKLSLKATYQNIERTVLDTVTWSSSNSSVISVSSDGTITGVADGSATIKAAIGSTVVGSQQFNVTLYLAGDVNYDGSVDSSDAALILKQYAQVQSGKSGDFTDDMKTVADFNLDSNVDSSDASLILRAYAANQAS